MTALDITVLLLVGWFGVRGLMNGFVSELLSLVAWVAAIAVVKLFHTPVSAALVDRVGTALALRCWRFLCCLVSRSWLGG